MYRSVVSLAHLADEPTLFPSPIRYTIVPHVTRFRPSASKVHFGHELTNDRNTFVMETECTLTVSGSEMERIRAVTGSEPYCTHNPTPSHYYLT